MVIQSKVPTRAYVPAVKAQAATQAARPRPVVPTPAMQAQARASAPSHAIAKWSLIGGTAAGAFGVPMLALLGGAGFGLWMLPAIAAGAALGAVAYGGIGFLVDRLVNHFRK